jgi:hypothetical protein
MMTSRSILPVSVRVTDHERAIVRALASLLEDALARGDVPTAADVARQLVDHVDRLRGGARDP